MKTKYWFLAGLAGVALYLSLSGSVAWAGGDATRFIATIQKIEIKNAAGDWITVEEGSRSFDFGVQNEPILVMKNEGKIPPGNYTNFRVTIADKIQFSGSDAENKTKEGGEIVYRGSAAKFSELPGDLVEFQEVSPSWNKESEGLVTMTYYFNYKKRSKPIEIYSRRDFSKVVEVKQGSLIKMKLLAELRGGVNFAWSESLAANTPKAEAMYMLPPPFTEASLSADATTGRVGKDVIEMKF